MYVDMSLPILSQMSQQQVVKLNVGGIRYETTLATLQAVPDSMLGKMFQGHNWQNQKDNNGEIFIDADGKLFRFVLNFLRHGPEVAIAEEYADELLVAARYFQLTSLSALIEQKCQRDLRSADIVSACWESVPTGSLVRWTPRGIDICAKSFVVGSKNSCESWFFGVAEKPSESPWFIWCPECGKNTGKLHPAFCYNIDEETVSVAKVAMMSLVMRVEEECGNCVWLNILAKKVHVAKCFLRISR